MRKDHRWDIGLGFKAVSDQLLLAAVMVGQIAILFYDKAYQYVQGTLWEKWRKRIL